jgi:MraZ protein
VATTYFWEIKLFLGKNFCTLDKQNRLLLPAAFRSQLSGEIYITQGFDRNLMFLTTSAFQDIYEGVRALNIADPLARLLFRMILGTAFEASADDSGQVEIPDDLQKFATLNEQVLLIGQGSYFEAWSPDLWKKQEEQLADAEANGSRFSELTILAR